MSTEKDYADFPPLVMTFAASDPSGGSGMQADVLTLASMGCHPLTIVTALTVQDTLGVEGVFPVDSDLLSDQARCVLEDMPVDAFKIGLFGSVENISAIAEIVADYPDVPLVLDPMLSNGRGDELTNDEMISAIRELILPQTTIIIPNSMEARRLAEALAEGKDANDDAEDPVLEECARRLLKAGCEYVLITGAHEATPQVINTLYGRKGQVRADTWQRLPSGFHGAGCTLSAAVAATLANGLDVPEAVKEAQDYTWHALQQGFRPGMGQYLPDHLFWARDPDAEGETDVQPTMQPAPNTH